MVIKCPECGHQVSSLAESCPNCGINIAGNIAKCPHCGSIVLASQDVCPNCLQSVYQKSSRSVFDNEDEQQAPQPESSQDGDGGGQFHAHKKLWATLVVVLVIVLGVMFIGYYFYRHTQKQNEIYAYENCLESNDQFVLQNYLDVFASAPVSHRDTVSVRLARIKVIDTEWENANVYNTKVAFQKYIQKHPKSSHSLEAKIKIDSLDWITAANQNTVASYKSYLEEHPDGVHNEDARMNYNKLTDRLVTPADEQMVMQLFTTFFDSMASGDEDALKGTLATVLNNFIQKHHASKWDVVDYVRKMHEARDIKSMRYVINNDWKIDKIENIETSEMEFAVTFSVVKHIERSAPGKDNSANYKVGARVSPSGKITDINVKKIES